MPTVAKNFYHKIYDSNGVYLATWNPSVINTPSFTWVMNGGMGEMVIVWKKTLKDFSEGNEVAMGNIIRTYIQDKDREDGLKIWEGVMNRYEPTKSADGTEAITIRAVSRMLDVQMRIIKNATVTTVTYTSQDPAEILKNLISLPSAGGVIKQGVISPSGTTVTYTFEANTHKEGFDKVIQLSPQYFYYWLDAWNELHYKIADFTSIAHRLIVGKHINSLKVTKSIEQMVNRVYFLGGGSPALYNMYERTSSQTNYGLRELLYRDERVTVDSTASTIATTILDNLDHPRSEIEVEVLDNMFDTVNGYDIESFKPGDIIQITDPEMESRQTLWDLADWDIDFWDFDVKYSIGQPHQIVEVNYQFNKAILKLSSKMEDVNKRIEDIKRNADVLAKKGMPSTP